MPNIWLRLICFWIKGKLKELFLLDDIKTSFYHDYGYNIYQIEEQNLSSEYKYLLKNNFVKSGMNTITDDMTAVWPTDKGEKVGLTIQEKDKRLKSIRPVIIGLITTVVSGLIVVWLTFMLGWNK